MSGTSQYVESIEDIRLGAIISYYRWDLETSVRAGMVVAVCWKPGEERSLKVTDYALGSRENPRIAEIDLYDVIVGCPVEAGRSSGMIERTLYHQEAALYI